MATTNKTLFLYCESSIHPGAGQSTGTIDNPIQREIHTNLPKIESSSLRGAIREAVYDNTAGADQATFEKVFGKKNSGEIHSAIDFGDARLFLFPIRSWKGVFAWVTCPFVLQRFARDWDLIHNQKVTFTNFCCPQANEVFVLEKDIICSGDKAQFEEFLFDTSLHEIKIKIGGNEALPFGEWISAVFGSCTNMIERLTNHIAIVNDDVFRDFTELFTEKITRNKIDSETGTAEGKGLFNEENLPPESILYAYAGASDEFVEGPRMTSAQVFKFFEDYLPIIFQGGGNKGIGKGLLRQSIYPKTT